MDADSSSRAPFGLRALSVVLVVVALCLAACAGDDDTTAITTERGTAASTTPTGSPTPTPSPAGATTTTSPSPPMPTPTATATATAPSAADSLAPFFAAARELDAEIGAAADVFDAGLDPDAGRLSDEARSAVRALGGRPAAAAELIPAGTSTDLETAVLAVFADLDSRVSALTGAEARLPEEPTQDVSIEFAMECLANGSASAARFADDLARAVAIAASEPVPGAASDSEEAGVLAVRIEAIDLANSGCDACGGARYDEPIPVDWAGAIVADGVEFTATFENGRWVIEINAC